MKVGVTGITGFLGSHVGKVLLNKGNYFVRGSVRSLQNSQKVDPILDAYNGMEDNYELFEANLKDKDSIFEFVKGLDYVIHVASPVPDVRKKMADEEVIRPAVDGTLNVLKAAHEFGVKKVVCTSSVATIQDPFAYKLMYDHEDFVDPDQVSVAYSKSKIIAEEKAWEYIKQLESENENPLQMSTIHPAYICGPVMAKEIEFLSLTFIKQIVTGGMPMLPQMSFGISDVRDVAEAHVNALEAPAGKRYVTSGDSLYIQEIAQIIKDEFPDQNFKVSTRVMPKLLAKFLCLFNPYLKQNMPRWGKKIKFDSSLAEEHLNFKARPARESIRDMVNSMIEKEYIKGNK